MKARLFAVVMGALLMGALLALPSASAFVVEGPDRRPWPAEEDVMRAARWDAGESSLVGSNVRGLGGGLEYAVDDSVCTALRFVDRPSCDAIKAAIAEAGRRWSDGNPHIRFTDVTGLAPPVRQGQTPGYIGVGAEVDFFADGPQTFLPFLDNAIAAMTTYYYDRETLPRMTTGATAEAGLGQLVGADIRLNDARCYYLDPAAAAPGCAHFSSVVLHELGHVIGVDHPDEAPERNLALTRGPDPCVTQAVATAPLPDRAVLWMQVVGARGWVEGLSADDLAGRDALYPPCAVTPPMQPTLAAAAMPSEPASSSEPWAAFARIDGGATLSISGAASQGEAQQRLESACAMLGRQCEPVASFVSCFAYAEDGRGAWAAATARVLEDAAAEAVQGCAARGVSCNVREAFCAKPGKG
jgi:hypothetical protein